MACVVVFKCAQAFVVFVLCAALLKMAVCVCVCALCYPPAPARHRQTYCVNALPAMWGLVLSRQHTRGDVPHVAFDPQSTLVGRCWLLLVASSRAFCMRALPLGSHVVRVQGALLLM